MITEPIIGFDAMRDDHGAVWERVIPMLRAAIARLKGTHEEIDVLSSLHTGHLFLWPGDKAAAVTEIQQYPRKRVCNVFLVGGRGGLDEIKEWLKRGGALEQWAFERWHCDWITYTGRQGWSKVIDCEPMGEVSLRVKT